MKVPYTCISCGYMVSLKADMRRHLYSRQTPCPKTLNEIELTNEIKDKILKDRIYRIPPPPPSAATTINQIVNYNNTINNLITGMDTFEKIDKYMAHSDIKLLEYGDSIDKNFTKHVTGLKQKEHDDSLGAYDALILDKDNLLEVIDQVSSLAKQNCENFNVVYDKKFNRLKLYDMGAWNEFILMKGINTLLLKIQDSYFNAYECYLIRKIEFSSLNHHDKAIIKSQLSEYYKFIGCFEIQPYAKDKNETEIIYNDDDKRFDSFVEYTDENTALPIKYTDMYARVCDETKTSELNSIKRNIVDIVKRNCQKKRRRTK